VVSIISSLYTMEEKDLEKQLSHLTWQSHYLQGTIRISCLELWSWWSYAEAEDLLEES